MRMKLAALTALIGLGSFSSLSAANTITSDPAYPAFKQKMTQVHGFDPAALDATMEQVVFKNNILEIMQRPGESKPWYKYQDMIINANRVNLGKQFYRQYKSAFDRAEQDYGVPASVILGILGVETVFGENKGSFRSIDALATLGFGYERRSKYFLGELESLLILSRNMGINPLRVKSSYAGAIGYPQFMPSSYLKWAIDYDGSGEISLNSSPVDAIGSVANYLFEHGWQPNTKVLYPAQYVGASALKEQAVTTDLTDLKPYAVHAAKGLRASVPLSDTELVAGVTLEGENSDLWWLTTYNFHVITTYNRSRKYAMAVYTLGQLIHPDQ